MPKKVWLIRHGESEANAGLRTPSHIQTGLTLLGHQQAEELAERWEQAFEGPPQLIVTSPFIRTQKTAEPLKRKFPTVPTEEWAVEEWTRLDPEKLRDTTFHERQPLVQAHWDRNDPNHREPHAESLNDLFDRVDTMLLDLCIRREERIAIFTHGHFMRATLWTLMEYPSIMEPQHMQRFRAFTEAVLIPNTMSAALERRSAEAYDWSVHWNYEGMGIG